MLALVAGWVAFAVYSETLHGRAADDRLATLRTQNAAIQQSIDERRRALSDAGTDSWLEEQARRLGYVRDGEKVFVPVTGQVAVPGGGVDPGPLVRMTPPPPAAPNGAIVVGAPAATPSPAPGPTPVVVDPNAPGR